MAPLRIKTILIAVLSAELVILALLQSGMEWRRALLLATAGVMSCLLAFHFSPMIWRFVGQLSRIIRRPKFSIRTLFLITAIFALLLATLGRDLGRTHQERAAVWHLEALGVVVVYDTKIVDPSQVAVMRDEDASPPDWSRRLLGVPGTRVTCVMMAPGFGRRNARNDSITDEQIAYLRVFNDLQVLDLRGTAASDNCLSTLRHIPNLKHVFVGDSRITEKGIEALKQILPNCRVHR